MTNTYDKYWGNNVIGYGFTLVLSSKFSYASIVLQKQ